MSRSNPNPYLKRLSSVLSGNGEQIGVIHLLGSIAKKLWWVREWIQRSNRSDCLSNQTSSVLDQLSILSLDSLKKSWESTPDFGENSEMEEAWNKIGRDFLDSYKDGLPNNQIYFDQIIKCIDLTLNLINGFEYRYSDFLTSDNYRGIELQKNILEFYRRENLSILNLYNKILHTKNHVKQVSAIRDWYVELSENVLPFIQGKTFPNIFIDHVIHLINIFCEPEMLEYLSKTHFSSDQERDELGNSLRTIASHMSHLKSLSIFLEELKTDSIKLYLRDKAFEINPNSLAGSAYRGVSSAYAEAKAFSRLHDIDDPNQWIVAVDREEQIDLEELDKKIRESGYLV
jgi:hypothetical protein